MLQNVHAFGLQKVNQLEDGQADQGVGVAALDFLHQGCAQTFAFGGTGAINRIRLALEIAADLFG